LVDHLPARRRLSSVNVAVGVAGDVGQHVADGPAGEQARAPHVLVGQPLDRVDEAPVRVSDVGDVSVWHKAHGAIIVA
jgi:hypothetical protein